MKVIGITGGVGSGKTRVLEYLNQKYGASICRTDEVARELQKKGKECYERIVSHFGEYILNEKGELNREALSEIVFSNTKELECLNAIVHPAVKEEVKRCIQKEARKYTNLFFVESALLIEDHYDEICDEVWYIYTENEIRKNRLIFTRGYSAEKVESIIAAQLTKKAYLENCDRIIDNSGVFAETMMQVDQIIKSL